MLRRHLLWIIGMVALTALPVLAQSYGHIQVKAAPGIQIFLDGDFKGITSPEVGGLIIQNVAPGSRRLKAFKPGFQPQETVVTVRRNEVLLYTVQPLVPKVEIAEKGDEQADQLKLRVGTLIVQSLPVECVIDIPSLGIRAVQKTKDQWIANRVPEGNHEATFRGFGKTLRHTIAIRANETRKLMVNFLEGKITDIGLEERRAAEQAERAENERRTAVLLLETRMAAHARAPYGLPGDQRIQFRVNGRCGFLVTTDYTDHEDRSRRRYTAHVNVSDLDPNSVRNFGHSSPSGLLSTVQFATRGGALMNTEWCEQGSGCRPSRASENFIAVDDEDVARHMAEALRTWIRECQRKD